VGYHSFWDVYNQLRDAMDSELLFESSIGAVDASEDNISEVPDANRLPLQHLQPCEFGKNGIPAVQYEGRAVVAAYDTLADLLSSLELPEDAAGLSDRQTSGYGNLKLAFTRAEVFLMILRFHFQIRKTMSYIRYSNLSASPATYWRCIHTILVVALSVGCISDYVIQMSTSTDLNIQ
jgi:hypothetical protein